MITKYVVSRDDSVYEAFPDVTLTTFEKLVCVFTECKHHIDRSYSRIVIVESSNHGHTWSEKRNLTENTRDRDYYYNCPRISRLSDQRLVVIVDRVPQGKEVDMSASANNLLYFSDNEGTSWSEPQLTPLHGIVPDKLLELDNGRWIISAHHIEDGYLTQFMHYSDDQGSNWSERITVGKKAGYNLCEASILPIDDNTLVAFMRENSGVGHDCIKSISYDNGKTWSDVMAFPLPCCHRPVAGFLQDRQIMITYRFMQGGKGWLGSWTQNFFAALTSKESALSTERKQASTRIMPIDFDRSQKSDLGYSGWVQFNNGEIYIVNYIVDNAPKGQIRGYALLPTEFQLPED